MKPALVFLDLEGTMIRIPSYHSEFDVPSSMWTVLAQMLGEECFRAEEESKRIWLNSPSQKYLEWMDESVKIFVKYGLSKSVLKDLLNTIQLIPGVVDFCTRMKSDGARIAIVTGAIKNIGELVQIQTGAHHLFAGCELYFGPEGEVVHWNLLPSDYKGKADFMRLLINEYKLSPKDCVFIGDGSNDIHLAKEVGLSIAYNGHALLKEVSTYSVDQPIRQENFAVLADLIHKH